MRALELIAAALLAACLCVGCGDDADPTPDGSVLDKDDAGTGCLVAAKRYAVGDVVKTSAVVSCVCLADGKLGNCTGVPIPDAGRTDDIDAGDDAGEGSDAGDEDAVCSYKGKHYALGDTIPKGGNVSCKCLADGKIANCTGATP